MSSKDSVYFNMKKEIPFDEQQKFIARCDKEIPDAAKNKQLTKKLKEILQDFSFSEVTAYKIWKKHERAYKPPAKKRERKGQIRLTEEEIQKILRIHKDKKWSLSQMVNNKVLDDRTPSKSTISNILRRYSDEYKQVHNGGKGKVKDEIVDLVVKLFNNGRSINQIQDRLNRENKKKARKTIENILVTNGCRIKQGKTEEEKDTILNAYKKLGTDKAIVTLKKVGIEVSSTTIRRIIKKLGFKRDNSDSYRKYTLNKNYFAKIDTPNKAYILGFIAADGSVYGNILSIELKNGDSEHKLLEQISEELGSNKPIEDTFHYNKRYNLHTQGSRVTFYSDRLVTDLNSYGITPNKTKTLHVNLTLIPNKYLRDFWRGVMDGDGSLYLTNGIHKSLCLVGSKQIITSFHDLIKAKYNISCKILNRKDKNMHQITYQKEVNVIQIASYLYENSSLYLERKYQRALSWYTKKEQY